MELDQAAHGGTTPWAQGRLPPWLSRLGGVVVAFEADPVDEGTHIGWIVAAVGRARIETGISWSHRPEPGGSDTTYKLSRLDWTGRVLSGSPCGQR